MTTPVLCRIYQLYRRIICLFNWLFEEIRRKGEEGTKEGGNVNLYLVFFHLVLCKWTNDLLRIKESLHFSPSVFQGLQEQLFVTNFSSMCTS